MTFTVNQTIAYKFKKMLLFKLPRQLFKYDFLNNRMWNLLLASPKPMLDTGVIQNHGGIWDHPNGIHRNMNVRSWQEVVHSADQ